jgi:hypothetical protein
MHTINRINARLVSIIGVAALIFMFTLPGLGRFQAQALSDASYVTLSSFSGTPDTTLTVSGGNFSANETILIDATEGSSQVEQTTTQATSGGSFSTNVTLPMKLNQGTITFEASGETSGLQATNGFYVSPFTPTLTPSASETTPYTSLDVSGSGYEANEPVILNFAGSTTTVQADATGSFSDAIVTTPNVPAASYTLVGVGQNSGASATDYQYINGFYASASPSSYYVMPATTLSFSGSGFAAGETVTVSDSQSDATLSSFTTTATGTFSDAGGFVVPASYAGLTKKFVLTGSESNATTTVSTTIGQYYPNVAPSSYYVLPGATLSFNGSGFVPNETVAIYSGTTELTTTTADSKGDISLGGSITIPDTEAGTTQTYTLVGQTSQGSGNASVQIGSYSPNASPSSYYLMPGSTLTFSGSGYAPDEIVAVFSGQTNLGSFTTDELGTFLGAGSVNINYDQANTAASYQLVGSVSKTPVNLSVGIGQMMTQITPSSYYVLPYAPFSVAVSGFAPAETVQLMNGTTLLATATTDTEGSATFSAVTLPAGSSSATLIATGTTSNASATATIGIGSYNPSVVASNYYARPGTSILLTGSGFAPNEPLTITAGSTSEPATADATGAFTAQITVPFGSTTSTLAIVTTGSMSDASSTTSITLAPFTPQVSPSTYYAQPGSAISFTGSGFVANEPISVSLNGTVVGSETADATGAFTSTGTYTLPFGTTASFVVTGETSGASVTMNIGLAQFYAGVQLSSYYGDGGSSVTASGSGFAAGEMVTISSGSTVLATTKASGLGAFTTPITIPYAAPGSLAITATGADSAATATTGYTVATVYNSAQLGAYVVPAGGAVNIIGSGFFAGEPVTVTSSETSGTYTIDADSNGSIDDNGYVLPADLPAGNLTLTITGTESYTTHSITLYVQG